MSLEKKPSEKENNIKDPLHEPQILETYIADHFPPNLKLAEKHGLAKRVARPINQDNKEIDLCDCCGLPTENELLPFNTPRSELSFLGPGFPLYFEFVVYCAVILGIMIIFEGIYNIISNSLQEACKETDDTCSNSDINRISLSNKFNNHELYKIQCWVNFGCAVAILISLQIFRRMQRLTNRECDRGLLSPSDYSIMISHIPTNDYTEADIKKVLEDFWSKIPKSQEEEKKGYPFKKIVLSYNIGEYIDMIRKKNSLIIKKRRAIQFEKEKKYYPLNYNPETIEEELQKANNLIIKYEKEAEKGISEKKCGVAFVSFDSELEKNIFFERCSFTPFQNFIMKIKMILCCQSHPDNLLFFREKILVVEKAPEPNDVFWENLHYSTKYKVTIRLKIYIMTFFILAICFGIILGISYGQTKAAVNSTSGNDISYTTKLGNNILGVLASFCIVFINTALTLLLKKFGNLEKHSTLTHLGVANALKLSYAQFFNTALIILVVKLITLEDNSKIFSPGYNISSDLVSIFCTNAIFPPILNFLNPWYFIRLSKRKKIRKEGLACMLTQAEAHSAFEGGDIDLSVKYAGLIKTVFLSGFYISVTPIGCIISFFGVIVFYFMDKYLLLRRYARPPLFSNDLNVKMVELIEYVPISMGLGSLIFHYILFDPSNNDIIPDLLTICLSAINFIIPSWKINECLFKFEDEVCEETKYDDARVTFPTDYDRANPVTQEGAMMEWIKLIEKKKGITLKLDEKNSLSNREQNEGEGDLESNKNLNNCLVKYANTNFLKLNNIIAQAPQNLSNSQNFVPFFNLVQQNANPNPDPSHSLPMFLQQQRNNNEIVNQNIINHSPNHEMVPLVNLNPKPNPDPSHINNPYFGGAPMIPGNHYPPYNNYPHMIPQQQFGIQSPTEYNYNDTANMNQNIAFDPIIPQYSNYNSEVSNRGHNIPPESFLPPIQFYQQNNHEQQQYPPNYGNFAMRY